MKKQHKKRSRDAKIFGRVSAILIFVLLTISFFFVYDIVLIAMSDDEPEVPVISEVEQPEIPEEPQVPEITEEPIKMYISDKTVYLAHLRADGKSYTFPFRIDEEATVQTLLDRAGVKITENDYINLYEITTPLFEDIYVEIGRITYEEVTETVAIPYQTEYVDMIYAIWKKNNLVDTEGKNGTKTIEIRCNDEKRQKIKVNDIIIFALVEDNGQKISVRVKELYPFKTFYDLYSAFDFAEFGCDGYTMDRMLEETELIYPKGKEEKYGALGIRIEMN